MSNPFEKVSFDERWSVPVKFSEWDRFIPVSDGEKTVMVSGFYAPELFEQGDRKIHKELVSGELSTPVLGGGDGSSWYVSGRSAYRIPKGTSVNARRIRS